MISAWSVGRGVLRMMCVRVCLPPGVYVSAAVCDLEDETWSWLVVARINKVGKVECKKY